MKFVKKNFHFFSKFLDYDKVSQSRLKHWFEYNKSMRLKSSFVIFAVFKRVYLFVGKGWRILSRVVGYGFYLNSLSKKVGLWYVQGFKDENNFI